MAAFLFWMFVTLAAFTIGTIISDYILGGRGL
jgi:hypothetical protein